MSCNQFQFKRFTIKQDECGMKVGTDGVLLGAWCRLLPEDKLILDIGTGTGLITLQLAQKTESAKSIIDAVEISESAYKQARENFNNCEWHDRLRLYYDSIQNFALNAIPRSYDHIVTNPPYFANPLRSPDITRDMARHTGFLSYETLIKACDILLKPEGRVSLILPLDETPKMIEAAVRKCFHISRRTEVWSTPKTAPKRCLLEFSRQKVTPEISSLTIGGAQSGEFSDEYRTLTRDFYLHF